MRLLLDTHAFLWWVADDPRLSAPARRSIGAPRNEVFFSAVSAWEIVLRGSLGKTSLPESPDRFVPEQLRDNAFVALPVTVSHALAVGRLPNVHRDPFDRLLIAQAIVEGLRIVTRDEQISKYAVPVIW